jgi:hypothetical protein
MPRASDSSVPQSLTLLLALAGLVLGLASCAEPRSASPAVAPSVPVAPVEAAAASPSIQTTGWEYDGAPGRVLTTTHYRIHSTVTRDSLLERLPRLMEAALAHYRTAITPLPAPGEPLESFVFATRPQWERMTQRSMGDEAPVYLRIVRGGFTARGRSVLFDIGMRDTLAIAAHEGWHQYTQTAFRDQLPTAFEEGLATYMEGFRLTGESRDQFTFKPWANPERFFTLRRASERGRLMPLSKLVRSTPQELMSGDESVALTYYAQVWALIHYLNEVEGGSHKDALAQMVRDASDGRVSTRVREALGTRAGSAYRAGRRNLDLLEAYTGRTAEDHDAPYAEFVKQITRVGSGEKVMRGQSPLQ